MQRSSITTHLLRYDPSRHQCSYMNHCLQTPFTAHKQWGHRASGSLWITASLQNQLDLKQIAIPLLVKLHKGYCNFLETSEQHKNSLLPFKGTLLSTFTNIVLNLTFFLWNTSEDFLKRLSGFLSTQLKSMLTEFSFSAEQTLEYTNIVFLDIHST